jgi:hypothetical protein
LSTNGSINMGQSIEQAIKELANAFDLMGNKFSDGISKIDTKIVFARQSGDRLISTEDAHFLQTSTSNLPNVTHTAVVTDEYFPSLVIEDFDPHDAITILDTTILRNLGFDGS